MEPLRPLSPGSLDSAQAKALIEIVTELHELGFQKPAVQASLPGWIEKLACVFGGADGFGALQNEVRRWIYWTRVPGYWLGYLHQEYAKEYFRPGRLMASLLYAHAQESCGDDDSAQATVELAYHDGVLNCLPDELLAPVVERLRFYHWYYRRWSQPGTLYGANPLLEHPYHYRSWSSLRTAFRTLPQWPGQASVKQLGRVVRKCETGPDLEYYLPLARRWLATALSDARRASDAAEQLRLGLEDAYVVRIDLPLQVRHDAEIGHLHRLRGETLGALLRLKEAEEEHSYGLDHEHDLALCSYWQALSAKKLGHVRLVRAIVAGIDNEGIERALEAYRIGRDALDLHLMITESPVARSSAQQLLRDMSDQMIDLAVNRGRAEDAIAEIESLGPRGAADALAELLAADRSGAAPEMQRLRATFHRHLTTVPKDFEEYLSAIPAERELRRAYRATRNHPDVVALVSLMLSSSIAARNLLAMRVPDTSVALFHVGELEGRIVVVDLDADPAPTCIRLDVRENQLRELHTIFRADLAAAASSPLGRGPAVDAFLEAAYEMLAEQLAALVERVRGRHVKLFPRAHLSVLPLHAVEVGDGRLIDHCDVSYGQSLGLLGARLGAPPTGGADGVAVLHDVTGTRYLAGAVAALSTEYGATVLRDPTANEALAAVCSRDVRDLVFACHGEYRPDDPAASRLRIAGGLSLARLFETSALPDCRSVTMAACSSGLARAEIASESVGLSSVFLAAGARTVIASLWEVNELATALLLDRHFAHTTHKSPARALNAAQRDLTKIPLEGVHAWLERHLPEEAGRLRRSLGSLSDPPFAAPVHWAPFTATGEF